MSRVFKQASQRCPRSLMVYERGMLEEIVELGEPEEEVITPEMILAAAREEAARKVQDAYAEGLRRGQEAGRAQFEASVAQSAAALRAAAAALVEARQQFFDSLEPQVLELTLAIAERVLHREAREDRDLVRMTARKALEHLTERESLLIRLHPADLEAMRAEKIRLLEEFDEIRRITLQADAAIQPGGCIVESSHVQMDGRIESQWASLAEQVRGTLDEFLEG